MYDGVARAGRSVAIEFVLSKGAGAWKQTHFTMVGQEEECHKLECGSCTLKENGM